MKRNYAEWQDRFSTAKGLRVPVLDAIGSEWMSQSDIASKIGAAPAKISQVMAWIRTTQQISIEVHERIDKPTLYRRKV